MTPGARVRIAAWALVLTGTVSPGCARYARSRAADLADVVPMSVAYGVGVGVSARGTAAFHAGLSLLPTSSHRFGYDDRLVRGVWHEYQVAFPWLLFADELGLPRVSGGVLDRGLPIVLRWQAMRDAPLGEGQRRSWWEPNLLSPGRHPPVVRESRGAFLVPEFRGLLEFGDLGEIQDPEPEIRRVSAPEVSTIWSTDRTARPTSRAWDLLELDAFLLFLGVRVGVRPVELIDFVIGWTGLDVLGDDLPPAVSFPPGSGPPTVVPPPGSDDGPSPDDRGVVPPPAGAPLPLEPGGGPATPPAAGSSEVADPSGPPGTEAGDEGQDEPKASGEPDAEPKPDAGEAGPDAEPGPDAGEAGPDVEPEPDAGGPNAPLDRA